MRCLKAVPRRKTGHSAFLMSALVLSSPSLIISLPLCSRGRASFAVKHSLNAELLKLGFTILDPRNGSGALRRLCLVSVDSSGMRACSLGLPRPSFHSCLVNHIHFSPQLKQNSENLRTVSTNKQLWLITCSAWHGQVWSGQLV